jgi:shikimate dehydrogenase
VPASHRAGERLLEAAPISFIAGLIGADISASRSPALHEAEGAAQGLRYVYKLVDIKAFGGPAVLPEILKAMELTGFAGTNVTYPCKQAVLAHLDELSPEAAAIGAVNTVVFAEGRRIGHNTDAWGFSESFRRGLPETSTSIIVQLGAGGAGSAVGYAALDLGVKTLRLFDVDTAKASLLAARLNGRGFGRVEVATDLASALSDAEGVINATPIGMLGHPGLPLDPSCLRPDTWVADLVYFPLQTELLQAARARGCRTLDGGRMAVFQATRAFKLFTGAEANLERMLRHFTDLSALQPAKS